MQIGIAQVLTQSPPDKLYVVLKSGQIPGYPIRTLLNGPADALRVHQTPLPTPGSWGVVLFPAEDYRNGVWLGSYYAQNNTAFNSTENPQDDYYSHYSGFWSLLDESGNQSLNFPDGTSINISSSGTSPATTRQVVNTDQTQSSVTFDASHRVSSTPSPFVVSIKHPTGASATINSDGSISLNAATSKKVDLTNGGNTASDALALVSLLVAAFNEHVHTDPQGGDTGVPTVQWTATTVESQVVGVSG
ncbi:MAG: hypothetical protein KGI54_16510 [Pseudomonadota bacterium]|nr:hypothetical protein [Pseudomonadota bacterium]